MEGEKEANLSSALVWMEDEGEFLICSSDVGGGAGGLQAQELVQSLLVAPLHLGRG